MVCLNISLLGAQYMIFLLVLLLTYSNITWSEQIITLFVHGIADTGAQAKPFAQTCVNPVHSFDFDCATKHFWRLNPFCCSLGQDNELTLLNQKWQELNQQFPEADGFILVGISRGASIIINFLARYQPQKVKAVVLESPFDTIDNVIKHKATLWKCSVSMLKKLVPLIFRKFDFNGIQPDNAIDQIAEDIPMLFVTVENDHMVPLVCTHNLMRKRREKSHEHIHHVHLMQGKHGKLLLGPDAHLYKQTLHSFFARYNLPYDPAYITPMDYVLLDYRPISLKNALSSGSRPKKARSKLLGSSLPPRPITS